jgi:SPP1 gp7 family putative phage head morphogenesis protein
MNWGAHKADVRIAAKNSVTMRAALRASINAQTIYEAYQETHPFVTDNNTQDRTRARAWAMLHVKIDAEPIKAALTKIYTDGFLLGLDASKEAIAQAEKKQGKALTKSEESDYVDWANWKPGNRAAALLYRPTGAFEKILANAGIVSKKIAANGYDRIGTALADSVAAGFSPARAAKVITEKIGDPARALTIAITEQNRAMSLASMQNYKDYGLEKVEWSGANPCEICAPNEGQVVALGEAFESGDTEPPVHPNCRCALLPVIDEAFYAELNTSGVDNIMPAEEAAPEQQKQMTLDEVLGYQREQGFSKESVTPSQEKAIAAYRGADYSAINEYLRTGQKYHGGMPFGTLEKYIPEITKAINAAPVLPAPITTYRGVSGSYAETIGKYKPGTIYKDKGFTSTALISETAGYFAELRNNQQFLRIEIDIPAGTKGLDMTGFIRARDPKTGVIDNKGEAEWLLPKGSKFEVTANDGKTMKVRLIP